MSGSSNQVMQGTPNAFGVAHRIVVRYMQPSRVKHHATKIVDYAIGAAVVSVIAIPLLFFLSMSGGVGSEPPDHAEQFFAVMLSVALAPADYTLWLVHWFGLSFSFVDWLVGVIVVPLFWGAVAYGVVQLCCALLRLLRPTPNQAMHQPAPRSDA